MQSGSQRVATLERGIVSVLRLHGENDELISYDAKSGSFEMKRGDGTVQKKDLTIRQFIKYLPASLQVELQEAINERSILTPEELSGLQ